LADLQSLMFAKSITIMHTSDPSTGQTRLHLHQRLLLRRVRARPRAQHPQVLERGLPLQALRHQQEFVLRVLDQVILLAFVSSLANTTTVHHLVPAHRMDLKRIRPRQSPTPPAIHSQVKTLQPMPDYAISPAIMAIVLQLRVRRKMVPLALHRRRHLHSPAPI